jgi:transcriptional regulator with XRE-family HTH domain
MNLRKSSDPTDRHVGSRVRTRRMMLGMSQDKLAKQLGVSFQQVQKYEKGINRMGASRLQHLSHILHVPVEFFFEQGPNITVGSVSSGPPSPLDEIIEFMATSDGLALAKAFMRIGKITLRRQIVQLVKQLEQTKS